MTKKFTGNRLWLSEQVHKKWFFFNRWKWNITCLLLRSMWASSCIERVMLPETWCVLKRLIKFVTFSLLISTIIRFEFFEILPCNIEKLNCFQIRGEYGKYYRNALEVNVPNINCAVSNRIYLWLYSGSKVY